MIRHALAIYVLWVAATYVLEGMAGTLLRSDAMGLRLAYALVANIAIGIVLPLWIIRRRPERFGFSGPGRTAVSVLAATLAGYALFAMARSEPAHPIVVLNALAQVWVVSLAEVLVCWGLIGGAVFSVLRRSRPWVAYLAASAAASAFFGFYHFAHSAPFNEWRMVAFLTAIGFATSAWWFASRDLYGTSVFHTFFGVTGVLAALEARALVPERPTVSVPLVAMAAAATVAVMLAGRRKQSPRLPAGP